MANQNEATLVARLKVVDQMSSALKKPQAALAGLQTGFESAEKAATNSLSRIGQQVKRAASGFGELDASTSRFMAKTATLTNKLLGVAVAAQGLGAKDGAFKAASDGLTVFAGLSMALPGPVGMAAGAVLGLATAFTSLKTEQREAADAARKFQSQMEENRKAMFEARGQQLGGLATAKNPELAATRVGIENTKTALGHQMGLLKAAEVEMSRNASNPLSEKFLKAKESALDAQENIDKLKKSLGDLQKESERLELDDKLKELDAETEVTHRKVMLNLITPLESAGSQLRLCEKAIEDLIRAQDDFTPQEFEGKLENLVKRADRNRAIVKALKDDEDAEKDRRKAAQKALENSWSTALPMAVKEYTESMRTAKDMTLQFLTSMQGAMSNAFEGLLSGGRRAKDALKNFLKDMKSMLIRQVSDIMSQSVMKNFLGLFGLGGTAAPGNSTTPTVDNKSSSQSQTGGVNLSSLGSAFGLDQNTMGAIGGALAGGAMAYSGIRSGSSGATTMGLAMTGMSIGALAGPFGALAGAAVGALVGVVMSRSQRRRAKRARRRAAYLAAIQHQQAVDAARVVLKKEIRAKMGGGLASEDAAAEIGQLFSSDLSEAEISQFGTPEQIAARAGAVETQRIVNVGGIVVHATVGADYDVQRLAESLGYHMAAQMGAPATGIGP